LLLSLPSLYFTLLPLPSRPPTPTLFPYTTLFRSRVDVARPGLRVGVDHERVDLPLLRLRIQHRKRAVGTAERQVGHRLDGVVERSEEHTSELQSPDHLVCRLLLEKKKEKNMQCHN